MVVTNERWSDGDEVHYLLVSSSLLKDGDLRLKNNYENKDYYLHHAKEERPHAVLDKDGEMRPGHGILTSVIVAPGYGLSVLGKKMFDFDSNRFTLFFPRLTILLIHIIFSLVLILYLRRLGFDINIALLTILIFLIQLTIIIFSQVIYPDLISAYFLLAGILGTLYLLKKKNITGFGWAAFLWV